ncbi:hypothetical protein K431DRAFT_289184 [Polychaeton citri CBS 116435]|uniref:DNA mismatch repair protein MutS core domain-containing protein n=1 Tax=Polychaeton citri CBS 116435 TaxID=1314669 RepID=A0A9P4PZ45_9PEZI|nr:hypothetical protein K431DRAFT_289184 [Polychaeton citri CBS 116435]
MHLRILHSRGRGFHHTLRLHALHSSSPLCLYGAASIPITPHTISAIRGAKTKTKIKAKDLPQGVLSPLPQHEDPPPPEKSYPTVLQQHLNNIRKFKNCIVLTRIGDFYELYFDQVDQYAPLVNLKKAVRRTALGDVPMAGFQYTQLERYLKMFVQDLGKQVAISEQVRIPEEERTARGGQQQYDRKVTRVVTAGTLVDESFVDPFENSYLLSLAFDRSADLEETRQEGERRSTQVGLAWVDLSSGDFFTQISDLATLPSVIARIAPKEIVLDTSMQQIDQTRLQRMLGDGSFSLNFHQPTKIETSIESWQPLLEYSMEEEKCSTFSMPEITAGSTILDYSQKHLLDMNIQLRQPMRRSDDEFMSIDKQSLRGLEIRTTLRDGLFTGSLLHTVRRTVTKSGARLLSQRLVSPSMSLFVINNRLNLVEEMLSQDILRETLVSLLRRTFDTLRLLQKFSLGRGDADDMLGLARTIQIMQSIFGLLQDHVSKKESSLHIHAKTQQRFLQLQFIQDILDRFKLGSALKLAQRIIDAIDEEGLSQRFFTEQQEQLEAAGMAEEVEEAEAAGEETPSLARRAAASKKFSKASAADNITDEIWIMRKAASSTLSRAHDELDKLQQAKLDLGARLRSEMSADSLTLKWSAQLGHFCHIKGKDAKNDSLYVGTRTIGSTKSTRSFYLTDWTHLGIRIDDAKRRIRSEEERVFSLLRVAVIENLVKLRRNAFILDELDVACSSATVAKEKNWIRPVITSKPNHNIIGGRHPMVDTGLREQGRIFTSNDCSVGSGEKIYLITGPNMGAA